MSAETIYREALERIVRGDVAVSHEDYATPTEREIALTALNAAEIETMNVARSKAPEQSLVTPDGYTKLPEQMRAELGPRVWFLRGAERWEAWPEHELEAMLNGRHGSVAIAATAIYATQGSVTSTSHERIAREHVEDLTSTRLPAEDVASNIEEDLHRAEKRGVAAAAALLRQLAAECGAGQGRPSLVATIAKPIEMLKLLAKIVEDNFDEGPLVTVIGRDGRVVEYKKEAIAIVERMCPGPDEHARGWEADYARHDQRLGKQIVAELRKL